MTAVSSQRDPQYEDRPDNQLEPFDPEVVDDAAKRGDAFIKGLPDRQKDLARRILFRLIRIPDSDEDISSRPAPRAELLKFGDPRHINGLLDGLKGAGILSARPIDGGEELALRYLALTRRPGWLAEEVKKRMNLRDLALSWIGSGRASGALLGWRLTRRFREYGNLKQWETDFINASSRYTVAMVAVVALVAVVMAAAGLASSSVYESWVAPGKAASVIREITSEETPEVTKVGDIKWLAKYHQKIEIPSVVMLDESEKDLRNIPASGAVFKQSKLKAVRFDGAMLAGASFNDSVIDRTRFTNAYLYSAVFDGSELCGGVDFSNADIFNASFKRVKFSDENVPNFTKAPWWQAHGWGFDEIALLHKYYPQKAINTKEAVNQSEKFLHEMDRIKVKLDQTKDPLERAIYLNEKAWTLAIYGEVADDVAENAASEALAIIDTLKSEIIRDLIKSSTEDTLAYILMQKRPADPAATKDNFSKAASLLEKSMVFSSGEKRFRYAVALHVLGSEPEAKAQLVMAIPASQYQPSHELYLLYPYITDADGFKNEIMNMTGRTGRSLPTRSKCRELRNPK